MMTYSTYFQVLCVKITIEDFQTKKDIILSRVHKRQRNEKNAKYRLKLRGTEKHNIEKETRITITIVPKVQKNTILKKKK